MAGISSKEIKNRIRSMQSTRQITRAMEMVAASKLRRAQPQVLSSRPYFESLYGVAHSILDTKQNITSVYLTPRQVKKSAWIVIAGDRGLAGSYNSNVLKLAWSEMEGKDAVVLPIGKKANDFFRSRKCEFLSEQYAEAEDISVGDCFSIAKFLCRHFLADQFDAIWVTYTNFVSALSRTPTSLQLLPLLRQNNAAEHIRSGILYEPDCESVFDAIIPEYVGGILYSALCESRAAEQAARRAAMDSATKNADELINDLSLRYNRARQAAITQEITEIVAGSRNS